MQREKINLNGKRIIISRTDSIGDVVLTLPVAAIFKVLFPESTIIFLGRSYTKSIIKCCANVDEFADWDELKQVPHGGGLRSLQADAIIHVFPRKEIAVAARSAGIRLRLGTTNRLYHWGRCNRLVMLSRRRSSLHESQLNLKLLVPFGAKPIFSLDEIPALYGLTNFEPLKPEHEALIDKSRFNLLMHPGSKGNGREWGLHNFAGLIELLPAERYKIFITGTKEEGEAVQDTLLKKYPQVVDLCGHFTLDELVSFIANTDGMIATGTGPLHVAAALGRHTIGIFPPIHPIHPGRWAPLGETACAMVTDHACNLCRKSGPCTCMDEVTPQMVCDKLLEIFH